MRLLAILLLCFIATTQATNDPTTTTEKFSPEPRNENRYYCLRVNSNVQLVVANAGLEWGKWISKPPNYNEIGSPVGKIVKPFEVLLICSSGRQASASGTTGYVNFRSQDNKYVKISWSNTWGGSLSHRSEQNDAEFDVTNSMYSYQTFDWIIRAK